MHTSNLLQALASISYSPLYTNSTGRVQFKVFLSTCTVVKTLAALSKFRPAPGKQASRRAGLSHLHNPDAAEDAHKD